MDFSDLEILTPELKEQLQDFGDAVQLDYEGFKTEVNITSKLYDTIVIIIIVSPEKVMEP